MTAPVPETKAEKLFEEFRTRFLSGAPIDAFTLSRYEREARDELQSDAQIAYLTLGALAAYQFNVAEMHRHHRAAIRLLDNAMMHSNYAISLQLVGLLGEASDEAKVASDREPENLTLLRHAIDFSLMAGKLDRALALCEAFHKRAPKETLLDMESTQELLGILQMRGLSQVDYEQSVDIAFELLRERGFHILGIQVERDSDGSDASVFSRLKVPCDLETALEMQGELAERFDERLGERWRPDVLMFEYCPAA